MTEDLGVGLRISDARPRTWDVGVPGVDLKHFPPNIRARGEVQKRKLHGLSGLHCILGPVNCA
jgi:hypothetical protein